MACNKCYNNSCKGTCSKVSVTRQIRIENDSIGRDGETAYEYYVRYGGTLTEEEWATLEGLNPSQMQKLNDLPNAEEIDLELNSKVDKEINKSLVDNSQIDKLEDLKTQEEIDEDIATATSNSVSSFIPVQGTVLPRGIDIPDYITSTGNTQLIGGNDIGGTTFTNAGGSVTSFNVPQNSVGYAYYYKEGDYWILSRTQEMPEPIPDGEVAEGDNRAISGNTAWEAFPKIETQKSPNQLFDKNNYINNGSFNSSNIDQNSDIGSARTVYIDIPSGQTLLSWTGLNTGIGKRLAFVDNSNNLILMNNITAGSGTNNIPVGATKFRFRFKLPTDSESVVDTFMLNFGTQKEYEPYEYIISINDLGFVEKIPKKINSIHAVLNGVSPVVNESNWYRATPVVNDVVLKGNTGLGYDLKRDLYVVSEYNSTISSRLLFFRQEDLVTRNTSDPVISTPYFTMDITQYIDHIQGCTWDFVDDTYLALGTAKGQATSSNNSVIVKISPSGVVLDVIRLNDNLIVQVGMIDVLIDGNIIIKPNVGNTAYVFSRSYTLINRVNLGINNEGICVNKFNGDIWCADDAFTVKKFNKDFALLATYTYNTFTNESSGSNVEGMCILPDGSLVISADAFLHGATPLGNSLFFFDFELTVNKRRYFYLPNGIGDYNNLLGEYTTEMINPVATITSIVTSSNFTDIKNYRSGATRTTVANLVFSSTLVSNTVFQAKIQI